MTRLDLAAERFAAALEALERAAAPVPALRDSAQKAASRLAEVNAERERLLARIAQLEDEALALSGIHEDIEGRLDGAIAEIRTALGR